MTAKLTLFLLGLATTVGPARAQLNAKALEKLVLQVVPVVEKATGASLQKLKVRLAERREMADAVANQARKVLLGRGGQTEATVRKMVAASRPMARLLLAKFEPDEFAILVCAQNFTAQAKLIETPELDSEITQRAVLVHECVHAVDEQSHGWWKTLKQTKSEDETHALSAIIEGNAQFLAAKICADNGWKDGFDIFTRSIGKQPPNLDAADQLMTSVLLANLYSAYHDGQRFVEHIAGKLGPEGIAKVFRAPPKSFEEILHPAWYLDPASRPKQLYELGKPVQSFISGFDEKSWRSRTVVATGPQIQAAINLLPKEDVDRIVGNLRNNKMAVMVDRLRPNSRMVVGAMYEFKSPAEASFYVRAAEKLTRIKKEKMASGRIRVVDMAIEDLKRDEWQGILSTHTVEVSGQKVAVKMVVASRGSVACEILYSNEPVTRKAITGQATSMLALATRKAAAKKPTSRKKDR